MPQIAPGHDGHEGAAGTDGGDLGRFMDADVLSLSLPSRLECIGKVAEILRQRALACGVCDGERGDRLVIALHEALTNAVVHGNLGVSSALKEQSHDLFAKTLAERSADPVLAARRVSVQFQFDGEAQRCQIGIADEGEGFDYTSWIRSLEAQEKQSEQEADPSVLCSGRGILMMRALADEVEYRQGGREVLLTLYHPEHQERRSEHRHPVHQAIRVVPLQAQGAADWACAWEALARNASAGGVALIQNSSPAASRVLLELQQEGQPVYIQADVCHVTALEGGLFQIGCRFSSAGGSAGAMGAAQAPAAPQASLPAAVGNLLQRLEQRTTQHERRAHVRVAYSARVQVRLADGSRRDAFSRDLSRGGMALVASFEVPHGLVELVLPVGGEEGQALKARVVRCQRVTAGVYDIGCQFV